MRQVIAATASFLDSAACEELAQLVSALESPEVQPVGK